MSQSVKLPSICEAEAEAFVRATTPHVISPDLSPETKAQRNGRFGGFKTQRIRRESTLSPVACVYCSNLIQHKDGFWRSQGDTVTCPARSGQGHKPPALSPLAVAPGRAYVAGDVSPALRSFLDGECGSLTCPDAAGDPLEPMKANFDHLFAMIEAKDARIATLEAALAAKGSLTCPDATGSCEPLTLQLSAAEVAELGEFDRLDQRRTQLLCELIFAARGLAQDQVVRECPGAQLRCLECLALTFRADQKLIHMDGCKAVRVLDVIGKLLETSSQLAAIATSGDGGVQ